MQEFHNDDVVLDIHDRPSAGHWVGLSIQHLFTMFGATVLVPILVGINPSIALVSSGLGTLVYLTVTKGKIPAYLGSSFAFIAAMKLLMKSDGYPAVAQGALTCGLVYLIVSFIIKKIGSGWLDKILPPIVVGPVVMVIGLGLASNAAQNAMYNNGEYSFKYVLVALITLALTIFFNMFFTGFLGLIPILLGIVGGYITAMIFGIIDYQPIIDAKWLAMPAFSVPFATYQPKLYVNAITTMAPIAFVTMTEHIGHLMVLNKLTKRNFRPSRWSSGNQLRRKHRRTGNHPRTQCVRYRRCRDLRSLIRICRQTQRLDLKYPRAGNLRHQLHLVRSYRSQRIENLDRK